MLANTPMPVFSPAGSRLIGQLHAPEIALLPRGADGVQVGNVRIRLGQPGQLPLQFGEGVAVVPVNVQPLRDLAGRVGPGIHRQQLRLFAASRAAAAAGGKSQHQKQGKAEAQKPLCTCFHIRSPFCYARKPMVRQPRCPFYFALARYRVTTLIYYIIFLFLAIANCHKIPCRPLAGYCVG